MGDNEAPTLFDTDTDALEAVEEPGELSAHQWGELERQFATQYKAEEATLARLEEAQIKGVERDNIRHLERMARRGVERCFTNLRSPTTRKSRLNLVHEFIGFGARAVLMSGSMRGGDFLMNQLFGQWAERTVMSMDLGDIILKPFGASSASMPGEPDHRRKITALRQIELLEGKRPDLIAFEKSTWDSLDAADRERVERWTEELLDDRDRAIVDRSLFGAEVKISKWSYDDRRTAGVTKPLAVAVKDEELEDIRRWRSLTGKEVLFFQAFLDEIYCMSFARMEQGITRGFLYASGDVESDDRQGAGGKVWHRFRVDGPPHLVGKALFPDESIAEVLALPKGSVVAFIRFEPAQGSCVAPEVVKAELAFAASRPSP